MLLHLKLQTNWHQFPSSQTSQIPAASQLTWHSQRLLPGICTACTLPASGPQRTLLLVVKKGIRFVLNPSSLLRAKQTGDTWRKELGRSSWELSWSCVPRTLRSAEPGPTRGCGIHSTALTGSCLFREMGLKTYCAITELDITNTLPGPLVSF